MSENKKFNETFASLNEGQREAVLSDANFLQILAGPGSGKTRVLTCRVAYLVIEKKITPKNILVVTFTNKAASEMKQRLNHLIGEKTTSQLLIGTFHSICCRLLRLNAKAVNLNSNFSIADTVTSRQIIERLKNDKSIRIDKFTRKMEPGAIFGIISSAKNKGQTSVDYDHLHGRDFGKRNIAILYNHYEEELQKLNLVDFDNLLLKARELLRKKVVLYETETILVDEYQDTNVVQYDLVELIMKQGGKKTLTVVGDPDQSIFGWRSAEPLNFRKMRETYIGTTIMNLEQNYRSTGYILQAASHVISQDAERLDKSLFTHNPIGKPISLISLDDEKDQANFVVREIKQLITKSNGLISYKDIAVLMRMNYISQEFERNFRINKIPFTIVGGDRFFDRIEVKDILAYMNFAYNPQDSSSLFRIINVPKRGLGDSKIKKIINVAEDEKLNYQQTIENIGMGKSGTFNTSERNHIMELSVIFTTINTMIKEKKEVSDIIHYIVRVTKYEEYLQKKHSNDFEARWNNIGELISIAQKGNLKDEIQATSNDDDEIISEDEIKKEEFSQVHVKHEKITENIGNESDDIDPIASFLEYCALSASQKELEEGEEGKVVISTLHSAKGLEWPCVFIASCNDGVIPASRSENKNEECRLLYVGMTRSKFFLYCLFQNKRNIWGETRKSRCSPFLTRMDEALYSTDPPYLSNETIAMASITFGKSKPIKKEII